MATCAAVEAYDCEAPAGFRTGSGTATSRGVKRSLLLTCGYCGEPVCSKCATEVDGKPVCLSHNENELLMWLGPLTQKAAP